MGHSCRKHFRLDPDSITVDKHSLSVSGSCSYEVESGGYSERHDEYMGGRTCDSVGHMVYEPDNRKENTCEECGEELLEEDINYKGDFNTDYDTEIEFVCTNCGKSNLITYKFKELRI